MKKEQVQHYIEKLADRKAFSPSFAAEIREHFTVTPITDDLFFVEELEKEIIVDYSI